MQRSGKFYPRRTNMYVPAMAYASDMIHEGPFDVDFGPMIAGTATDILNAQSAAAGFTATLGGTVALLKDNTDPVQAAVQADFPYGPGFGRCLQIVLSAAGTPTVTIRGRDYIGQPMTEVMTGNGTTPVIGNKAFKYIDSVTVTAVAANLSVGTTDKLGLPYRMENVLAEHLDGVRVATLGTLVAPSYIDPQTGTTTDPRGTYDPQSTLNGTAKLSATFIPNPRVNAAGNGGLHGIQHYTA